MSIFTYIASINEGVNLIKTLLSQEFKLNEKKANYLALEIVKPHLDKLKNTCYLVAETQYIDKVYRNSFYHYYSSKLNGQKRECLRISIFNGEIVEQDFRNENKIKELQKKFMGFFVLRPTEPNIIGRSVISPKALKLNNFLSCTTKISTTVNSIKLDVEGFPHSSQDNETLSCAETTLWALMEYFSTRYQEYKPVLSSRIVETLNKVTAERQLPSGGLDIQQISFALKEFGFGSRIYSFEYENDFEKILSCYIESGIPLILCIDDWHTDDGNTGHAMLCIGREKIKPHQIDSLVPNEFLNENLRDVTNHKKLKIFDWDSVKKEFVFVDDNFPVYQKALLSQPTKHYNKNWHDCLIKYFIVPLYPKIYLEAYEAKNYVLQFLIQGPKPLKKQSKMLIRFYLASSRSYKNKLALNSSFNTDIKEIILESSMPKFIWIAEITDKDLAKGNKANGIVILDATEANTSFNKPLIFACYQDKMIKFDESHRKLEVNKVSLHPFLWYSNLRHCK